VVIKTMCSSRIDPQHVLDAFNKGADGVLIGGCHYGDCHYVSGNHQTYRRVEILKKMLPGFGVDKDRLRLEWISAAEGGKLVHVINEFTEKIRALGPNK
jgi:F420-non-reducing hydrogenase iron-sulfur subunit